MKRTRTAILLLYTAHTIPKPAAVTHLTVKGTIHFVSAAHAIDAEVRLYDRLFTVENPSDETGVNDFTDNLNKDSMIVLKNAKLESNLTNLSVGDKFQFLRLGYFCVDKDSTPEKPVFNRTVALKDSWKKINK